MIGWDVDGRTPLGEPGTTPDDGLPLTLRTFLIALIQRNPDLHIHILLWDFTVLYSLDRELLPSVTFGWATPERIHFGLDDAVPLGGAQHEKVVVVDGKVAFCGGLDIALKRWDTQEHTADDERRRDPDGVLYQAFHDVQMAVDGEAAAVIAGHLRDRWTLATGHPMHGRTQAVDDDTDIWPQSVEVELRDVPVGISRTRAAYGDLAEAREIMAFYVNAITRSRRYIYIENQYLTSTAVADALAERLSRTDPPEVLIVSSAGDQGWLEGATMGAGRVLFLDRLRDSGAWEKVRVLGPWVSGPGDTRHDVKVHSKIMVVDDHVLTIGSANLANRSMGLDCEINLSIESDGHDGDRTSAFVASVRDRLLGEHTGAGREAVTAHLDQTGSLLDVVDNLGDGRFGRGLRPVPVDAGTDTTSTAPLMRLGDPEEPVDLENFIRAEGGAPLQVRRVTLRRRALKTVLLVLLIASIAGLWQLTPLRGMVDAARIESWIVAITQTPWAPVVVLLLYVGLGLIVFPITVLIAGTGLVFGPALGFFYAMSGSLLSAVASYGIGHILGGDLIRRYAGNRVNRLSRRMGRHGILTVIVLRVAPVAPFTVINLLAGASHLRAMDFLIGTVLGMAPGVALMTIFGTQIAEVLSSPTLVDVVGLVAIFVGWLGASMVLQRLIARRRRRRSVADEAT